jgi:hypothetical protein
MVNSIHENGLQRNGKDVIHSEDAFPASVPAVGEMFLQKYKKPVAQPSPACGYGQGETEK